MDWQPIETAPRDGTAVLVYCPYYGISVAEFSRLRRDRIGAWRIMADKYYAAHDPSGDSLYSETATQWAPLPPRPDDADGFFAGHQPSP
jgi:hypothetical protein